MTLKWPNTLESLYQISDQSIWFLIWILKKERFWKDLTREALEIPFTAIREYYWLNDQIKYIVIHKNYRNHGIYLEVYENGQLKCEDHWKDGKRNGIYNFWYKNGQLRWEHHWKDGKQNGIQRSWYENGQLRREYHLKDGKKDGIQCCWDENGQLFS